MKRFLVPVALLMVSLSGCLGDDDAGVGPGGALGEPVRHEMPYDAMPTGDGHDHADAGAHQMAWNYELVDHNPMFDLPVDFAGVHVLDMKGDWLFAALWGSHAVSADGGLVIFDISDPLHPVEASRLTLPGPLGGDRSMEVTDDGNWVVLGFETLDCFGHASALSAAVKGVLVDVSDKSSPVISDAILSTGQTQGSPDRLDPGTAGYHSVTVQNIDGTEWAFLYGELWRIDKDAGTLVYAGESIGGDHDMYMKQTPWGDTWAFHAAGQQPFAIYNVNDPTAPELLGLWEMEDRPQVRGGGPDGNDITWYFHTADAFFFEDQTIVVLSSEDIGAHTSPFWILDATDPGDIQEIGRWENPWGVEAGPVTFSLHNQRFHDDGLMTITHYHGGVFQMDFRHPDFRADPDIIAHAAVAAVDPPILWDPQQAIVAGQLCETDLPGPAPGIAFPEALHYIDVMVNDGGVLYIADYFTGLYTFAATADHSYYGTA